MPAQFVVDQAATFSAVVLLSSEPKRVFGSEDQDRAKDGTPKWEVQCVCGFRDASDAVQRGPEDWCYVRTKPG
jgi:hypothetical protein